MKKILYADDARSMRSLVEIVLGKAYDLTIVEDGAQAFEMAKSQSFDLVISDINMPNMTGLEFLEKFRQLENNQFTPVLMMTTEASRAMREKGRALGATGWIVKPFDPQKLPSLIERACS